jgi:N-acetylglutamate synthase/N-acetylornithine aminotransferase
MSHERNPAEALPRGFLAGAVRAPIRADVDKLDVAILYSKVPCVAAAVYTSNRVKAAPLIVCREHLSDGRAQAVIANSGCANACTGEQGLADARQMATLAAASSASGPGRVGREHRRHRYPAADGAHREAVSRIELSGRAGPTSPAR